MRTDVAMIDDEIVNILRIENETSECKYLAPDLSLNWDAVDGCLQDSGESFTN